MASISIAKSKVENPRAKDIASISKRKKSVANKPKKITIFDTSNPTPALTLPLPAKGVSTHAIPKVRSRKLTPMNTPPSSNAVGATIFLGPRVASSVKSRRPCHNSMRRIVFFDLLSIAHPRELSPVQQPHKGSCESDYSERYQEPRRRTEVAIQKISYQQASQYGSWKFESNAQI